MNSKLKDAHMDALFNAVLSLNTLEECYNFYEDLCTITELRAMDLQRYRQGDRRFDRYDQPCEQVSDLRHRRLPHGA